MASPIRTKSMPPGIRFHPTDEELCMYYLKRKALGKSLRPEMISEVDVYRFAPWDLPSKSCLKTRDLNWYFFCPRSKKYPHGGRSNRSTEYGYWKATGNDRTVKYDHRPVGKIKTLIFHLGKAPQGERTDWVMHEYRLEDKVLGEKGVPQDAYVICKVYKKSGLGPKNAENYGAPFVEEEWESDDDSKVVNAALTPCWGHMSSVSSACNGITASINVGTEEDDLERMLAMFGDDNDGPNNLLEDIFGGLEDLSGCWDSKVGSNWSQFDDGGIECFIDLDDLN